MVSFFDQALCLASVGLFPGQCLDDGSEVLASVSLEAKAEGDGWGLRDGVALKIATVEGVLVKLFNLRGPSAMISSTDRLPFMAGEVADTMLHDGPQLFPATVSALVRQQRLEVGGMGCKGLIHVHVEIVDVGRLPHVVGSSCVLVVVVDVVPQLWGGNRLVWMCFGPFVVKQAVAIRPERWLTKERCKVLLCELLKGPWNP